MPANPPSYAVVMRQRYSEALAKKRKNMESRIRRLERGVVKPEYKVIYTHTTGTATYAAGAPSFVLLNGCNQGDGQSSRDGRQILNKSVEVMMQWASNVSATTDCVCRAMLFIDLEPHGSTVTAGELLNLSSPSFGVEEAPKNLDYRSRFVIIKDKKFNFVNHPAWSSTAQHRQAVIFKYRKLNFHSLFDASNNADITDITKGALYLMVFANDATYAPTVDVAAKVRFIEN